MATNKLAYFEYAGHAEGSDQCEGCSHMFDAFDTPNGFVLILTGNNIETGKSDFFSQTTIERIRYYLNHEQLDDPQDAVRNAMIYANGFIHASLARDPDLDGGELSCLCVLIRDRKVYYAWVGQAGLYLYMNASSKLVSLSWDEFTDQESNKTQQPWKMCFLGQYQTVNPGVCKQAYVPQNDDILLMGTSTLYLGPDEKNIRRILSDSMPTHTKAQRLVKHIPKEELPAACQLIRFYNLENEKRSFAAPASMQASMKEISENTEVPDNTVVSKVSAVRLGILAVIILILAYMVYDLFLFNPRPARDFPPQSTQADAPENDDEQASLSQVDTTQGQTGSRDAVAAPATAISLPDDIIYVVKSGDTWGKIYREYEVCSWFIRNHPPNAGKFDQANNPVAGSSLAIPVMYSARQRLNPNYYLEFSMQNTGTSCQHANQSFISNFREKIGL